MNLRKALLLGLIAAVLAFYLYRIDIPKGEREAKQYRPFADLDKASVSRLEIERTGGAFALRNEKPGKKEEPFEWTLEGVPGAELDPAAVSRVLESLTALDTSAPLAKEELSSDLSVYGLVEPPLTLKVVADPPAKLDYGKRSEYLSKRYLRLSSAPEPNIYLVSEDLYKALDKEPKQFRKTNPLDVKDADLKVLALEQNGTKILLQASDSPERKVNGMDVSRWQLIEPVAAEANDDTVSEIVRQLKNLKATDFLDGQEIEKTDALFRLEFKPELSKDPLEIRLARIEPPQDKVKGKFAVSTKPTIYVLEQDPLPSVVKTADELRENRIFRIETDRVEKIEMNKEGRPPIVLSKSAEGWKIGDRPANGQAVEDLIYNLRALKASSFPTEEKDFGFAKPALRFVLSLAAHGENAAVEIPISFGSVANRNKEGEPISYYAISRDGKVPFEVTSESFKEINVEEQALTAVPTPAPAAARSAQ